MNNNKVGSNKNTNGFIKKYKKKIIICIALIIILGILYYFCSEDCVGYGSWSIRYDYRKSMRRARQI